MTASSISGSTNVGISSCARRNCTDSARRPSAATTTALPRHGGLGRLQRGRALEVRAGDGDEHVVERRRLDLDELDLDARLVERAHDRRDRRVAGRRADADARRRALGRRLDACRARASASHARAASSGSAISTCTVGSPTRAFSDSGVPSATRLPRAMIPTRSASCSASSRYWVVRNTVVPSSCSARTSRHSAARLVGSRPVVGSSRNSTCGRCTSASARSSRRRMPPE